MRVPWKVVAATALGLVAGCGTVKTATAPSVELARHQSYALTPWPGQEVNPNVDATVRAALERSLAARGFVPATTTRPDFLVAYRVQEHQAWTWLGADNTEFTQGTLTVAFLDPATSQTLWIGKTQSRVDGPAAPSQPRLERVVARVVDKSPQPTTAMVAATSRTTM